MYIIECRKCDKIITTNNYLLCYFCRQKIIDCETCATDYYMNDKEKCNLCDVCLNKYSMVDHITENNVRHFCETLKKHIQYEIPQSEKTKVINKYKSDMINDHYRLCFKIR